MDKVAMLTELLSADPKNSFARYGLAMAYLGEGKSEAALAEFQRTTDLDPDYVPAYQMSGQTLVKVNRTADARARLREGLAAAERTGNRHAAAEMQALLDELNSEA